MSYIKKQFSIKDLEVLSGIKAHTLRMWEKRYGILTPQRTDTNIRTYGLDDLQKLLNISFLNENGYKISRISKLKDEEINELVKSFSSTNHSNDRAIKSFTLSMYNFDQNLFFDTYNSLLKTKTFREIFYQVFIPLLNIENLQQQKPQKTHLNFVLFLPENEVHDLGILYTNYEILLHGYQAIYLGQSLPMGDLKFLNKVYDNIRFISYFTVKPVNEAKYLEQFNNEILSTIDAELWVLGKKSEAITETPSDKIKPMKSLEELVRKL